MSDIKIMSHWHPGFWAACSDADSTPETKGLKTNIVGKSEGLDGKLQQKISSLCRVNRNIYNAD